MARYGAVDIGSNSVRTMVAEAGSGQPTRILAEDRQVTRLGSAVFLEGRISEEASEYLCANLAKTAQLFKKLEVAALRAVATSAVRDASNQAEFIAAAQAALGYPVEIISGQEEARLIHAGVNARWAQPDRRALIIDVGGGSTEIILSDRRALAGAFSKPLGAVRLTEVFLKHDPPLPLELRQMHEFIDEKLGQPLKRIGRGSFDVCIGTSATAAAIVSSANRVPRPRREEADRLHATLAQVRALFDQLSRSDVATRRGWPGIGPRRAELIVAGVAVFLRVMESFEASSLYYSVAGVRDGIIADLAARGAATEFSTLLPEQRSMLEAMAEHYGVQLAHARQVASFARYLFEALRPLHRLPAQYGRLLEAAAYLHDIGHFVSDTAHHKHSYYLVANSDMAGFNNSERLFIAALTRYHRKSSPAARHPQLQAIDPAERQALSFLVPILRLADSLDRSQDQRIEAITVELRNGNIVVSLTARADTGLEVWAAEQNGQLFREIYGAPLLLTVPEAVLKGPA